MDLPESIARPSIHTAEAPAAAVSVKIGTPHMQLVFILVHGAGVRDSASSVWMRYIMFASSLEMWTPFLVRAASESVKWLPSG